MHEESSSDINSSDDNACSKRVSKSHEMEFIKTYERLPILWDVNHPDYSNKYRRAVASDALLEIMKKWDKSATRLSVRQKINILRSSYRKDLRKFLLSKAIGPDGEEIYEYKPSNWKFYALRFLGGKVEKEVENNKNQNSIVEIKLDSSYFEDGANEEVEIDALSLNGDSVQQQLHEDETREKIHGINKKNKKKRVRSEEDYYIHDSMLEREFEAISSNVICKLRRMNPEQRCHAELLMNKVLIGGLKNMLTDETDLTEVYK